MPRSKLIGVPRTPIAALVVFVGIAGCGGTTPLNVDDAATQPNPAPADAVDPRVSALIEELGDSELRDNALSKLGELGELAAPAIPAIERLAGSGRHFLRSDCVRTLGSIGFLALEALKRIAIVDMFLPGPVTVADDAVGQIAARSAGTPRAHRVAEGIFDLYSALRDKVYSPGLARELGKLGPAATDVVVRELRSECRWRRLDALMALGPVPVGARAAEVASLLGTIASSRHGPERREACRSLDSIGPEGIPHLLNCLRSPHHDTRVFVAGILKNSKALSDKAAERLKEYLSTSDVRAAINHPVTAVRGTAFKMLAPFRASSALDAEALFPALEDPYWLIRRIALSAVSRSKVEMPLFEAKLLELLPRDRPSFRVRLGLSKMLPDVGISAGEMERALNGDDLRARRSALLNIGIFEDLQTGPRLEALKQALTSDDWRTRSVACYSSGRTLRRSDAMLKPMLAVLTRDKDPRVRGTAAHALANALHRGAHGVPGQRVALIAIVQTLADSNDIAADGAQRAIVQCGDRPLPFLVDALDGSPGLRRQAAFALTGHQLRYKVRPHVPVLIAHSDPYVRAAGHIISRFAARARSRTLPAVPPSDMAAYLETLENAAERDLRNIYERCEDKYYEFLEVAGVSEAEAIRRGMLRANRFLVGGLRWSVNRRAVYRNNAARKLGLLGAHAAEAVEDLRLLVDDEKSGPAARKALEAIERDLARRRRE